MEEKRLKYLILAFLFTSIFTIYSNSLYNSFHLDDNHSIVDNPYIRDWKRIPCFFASPGMFSVDAKVSMYRPFLLVTYTLNYQLGGYSVFGYHIVNILLHIFNTILVYFILSTLFSISDLGSPPSTFQSSIDKRWFAFLGALLFGVHTLNTQAVNYISSRSVLLVTFFYLLAFHLYIKSGVKKSARPNLPSSSNIKYSIFNIHYLLALVSYALALLSKEIAITLPLILILCDLLFGSRQGAKSQGDRILDFGYGISDFRSSILRHLPFWVISVVYLLIRKALFHRAVIEVSYRTIIEGKGVARSIYINVITQIKALVFYISKLFYPVGLSVDHYFPVLKTATDPTFIASLSVIFLLISIAILCIKRNPLISLGVFWFFIALLPETILPLNMVINEHRTYLPGVGFPIAISAIIVFVQGVVAKGRVGSYVSTIGVGVLIVYIAFNALTTYNRNIVWQDDYTLWTDVVEKNPLSFRGWNEIGRYFVNNQEYEKAEAPIKKAMALKPNSPFLHNLQGIFYEGSGRYDEAIRELSLAVKILPSDPRLRVNLAVAYMKMGRNKEAIDVLKKVVQLNPYDETAYYNMGVMEIMEKRIDEAEKDLKRVIDLNPGHLPAYNNLGGIYLTTNRYDDALKVFLKILKIYPDDPDVNFNLGLVYEKMGKREEAKRYFERFKELKSKLGMDIPNLKMQSEPFSAPWSRVGE